MRRIPSFHPESGAFACGAWLDEQSFNKAKATRLWRGRSACIIATAAHCGVRQRADAQPNPKASGSDCPQRGAYLAKSQAWGRVLPLYPDCVCQKNGAEQNGTNGQFATCGFTALEAPIRCGFIRVSKMAVRNPEKVTTTGCLIAVTRPDGSARFKTHDYPADLQPHPRPHYSTVYLPISTV